MDYNTNTYVDYKNYIIFNNYIKICFDDYQHLTKQYSVYLDKYGSLSDFDKMSVGESEIQHELKLTPYNLLVFHRLLPTNNKIQQLLKNNLK